MIVSRIGDDLAVRLTADDVARLGLKEGDAVDVTRAEQVAPEATAGPTEMSDLAPEEWLIRMRKLRGLVPSDFKFDREEANER